MDLRLILSGESRALETGAVDRAVSDDAAMPSTRLLHLFNVVLAITVLHYIMHLVDCGVHLGAARHMGLGVVRIDGSGPNIIARSLIEEANGCLVGVLVVHRLPDLGMLRGLWAVS